MRDIVNVRGTIAANGGTVIVSTGGQPGVGIELEGTWVGTLHIQETVSGDGFVDAQVTNAAGTPVSAVVTGNGKFFVAAAGRSAIQVIATAWTSGTATVVGVPTAGGGGGAITAAVGAIVDGAVTALGTTTDAGIITDTTGTVIGFLRGQIIQWAAALLRWGSLTETAPASDTGSSGLNGRLQRVAQRLTSLIALLPAALVNGALAITGDTAHGATDAGNPVEQGYQAIAYGTAPTPVTAGQRVRGYASRGGFPFHLGGHPNVQTFCQQYTSAQTNTAVIAGVAATKIVVLGFSVTVANATTVDVSCRLGFGATVPAYGSAQLLGTHPGIAGGSGFAGGDGAGVLGVGASADPLSFTCSAPTSGSVDVHLLYFTVSE